MASSKKVTMLIGFVPVRTRIEVATEDDEPTTRTVCTGSAEAPHAPARVKTEVGCPDCGLTHSSVWGFPQRAIEQGDRLVVVDADELKSAAGAPRTGRVDKGEPAAEVKFHPKAEVFGSTVAMGATQTVYPDRGGEKSYLLLRDTLAARPDLVATMIWAPSSRNALWVLEVVGEHIVASKRSWPEQRRLPQMLPAVDVEPAEAELFTKLIDASVTGFDLGAYVNESKRGVEELAASREGVLVSPEAVNAATAVDLLAQIQASLQAAQPVKKPARKAAAKKPAAKKTAATRTSRKVA